MTLKRFFAYFLVLADPREPQYSVSQTHFRTNQRFSVSMALEAPKSHLKVPFWLPAEGPWEAFLDVFLDTCSSVPVWMFFGNFLAPLWTHGDHLGTFVRGNHLRDLFGDPFWVHLWGHFGKPLRGTILGDHFRDPFFAAGGGL